MKILKIFDLYGTKFHLYINKKPKYYSIAGGICTIISVILFVSILLILSLGDLKRKEPFTSFSSFQVNNSNKIKLEKGKIYLPWRIIDYSRALINHKGIIYPIIDYYIGQKKNEEGKRMVLEKKKINYKLCNETSMQNLTKNYILDVPLNELYCIDLDDLYLGGSLYTDNIYFIEFNLYLCKNGENYYNDNNCTSYEAVKELYGINNEWFVELFYPNILFQPKNKTNPIVASFKNYLYKFQKNYYWVNRIYFQEHVLIDDQGWVFNLNKKSNYLGINPLNNGIYINSENGLFGEKSSSLLFSLNIYLDQVTIYYSRKYKKLYVILAEIYPVLNLIIVIIGNFIKLLDMAKISKKIVEYMSEKIDNNKFLNKVNKDNKKSISLSKAAVFQFKHSHALDFYSHKNQKKKAMFENSSNFLLNSNILLGKNELIRNSKKKSIQFSVNKELKNIQLNENKSFLKTLKNRDRHSPGKGTDIEFRKNCILNINEKSDKGKQNKIIIFSLIYYLLAHCLNRIKNINNVSFISKKFTRIYSALINQIDINSYLQLHKEFELLKKMFLVNKQIEEVNKNHGKLK